MSITWVVGATGVWGLGGGQDTHTKELPSARRVSYSALRMLRELTALLALTPVACATKQAPASPACTFETPLVPGVPGSPGHLMPSSRNPNGASELASHMRLMADDLTNAKVRLLAGEPVSPLWARHQKIRCSWPTEPADRTPAFDAMAQTYLSRVKALDSAADKPAAYRAVLTACRACHEATCEGPLVVIDGLALEAN